MALTLQYIPILVLLASVRAATAALPQCDTTTSSYASVLSSCDVSDIRELHSGIFMDFGSPELCSAACVSALNTLSFHAFDCSGVELDNKLGFTDSKGVLRNVSSVQETCGPPSVQCFRLMRDLHRFEASGTGDNCLRLLDTFSSELRETVASAMLDGKCCGVSLASRFRYEHHCELNEW